MKFICVPLGSAGDVQPLTWLGRVLSARGHEVVIVVQRVVEQIAQRSGLRYLAVGDLAAQEALIKDPGLWHPRQAFEVVARAVPMAAREMMPAITQEIDSANGGVAILAGSLAFGARILGEKRNVPVISVHLQPSLMMSVEDTPVMMAGMEWLPRMPRWLRRMFFGMANWQIGRIMNQPLRELCLEGGLPAGKLRNFDAEKNIWHSPDGILCLFPEWFAPKARDWPARSVTTRFPLYDEAQVLEEDSAMEAFLRAGNPPILFTPGSANAQAATFLKEAVATCQRMGRRGILATRYPEQVPANLPDTVKAFDYIPFGRIFSRCAAIVHHGGVGTTAQCLAAGTPQLIMPMAHDQPDNGAARQTLRRRRLPLPQKIPSPAHRGNA